MTEYLLLVVYAVLVNNILLAQFLGNCPFLGTSQKMSTATGMAMAVNGIGNQRVTNRTEAARSVATASQPYISMFVLECI